MRFGNHPRADFGVSVIHGGDDIEIVRGGAIGGASGNHRTIGQVEGNFVLDGAIDGLFELAKGANHLSIFDNLVALGLLFL